jgi:hypothetical protein
MADGLAFRKPVAGIHPGTIESNNIMKKVVIIIVTLVILLFVALALLGVIGAGFYRYTGSH